MTDKEENTEMAQDRTEWAEDRTVLANERTFAGWMRTGMAAVALGVGLQAVFGEVEPVGLGKIGATVFLLIGIAIFQAARRASCRVVDRMNAHATEPVASRSLSYFANALTAATALVCGILWLV